MRLIVFAIIVPTTVLMPARNNSTPQDTLNTWLAREAELKGRIQSHGVGRPAQFAGKA
jgi:hypothetical protein